MKYWLGSVHSAHARLTRIPPQSFPLLLFFGMVGQSQPGHGATVYDQYVADHEGRLTKDSFVEVSDLGEKSVSDFQSDMDIALVIQEVNELRSINAALRRIENGDYGYCVDCGNEIARNRLEINPAAERCIDCQAKYEREHGTKSFNPTL